MGAHTSGGVHGGLHTSFRWLATREEFVAALCRRDTSTEWGLFLSVAILQAAEAPVATGDCVIGIFSRQDLRAVEWRDLLRA